MNALTNPIFLRAALLLFAAAFAFAMGVVIFRRMRRSLTSVEEEVGHRGSLEQLPLHTYHAVIQQLKQQKHELTTQQQAQRRLAKTTENISASILSNLSSGVLFFNTAGLVKQANKAAKHILGYASPTGMSAKEVFRGSVLDPAESGKLATLSEAIAETLGSGVTLRNARAEYSTPAYESRVLLVTVSPVYAADGSSLGAACLFTDQSETAQMEKRQQLRGELSAEMALTLRTSLVTISGYAQQLAKNCDPDMAQQLASDIAHEAAHLDRKIGGFLAGAKDTEIAAGKV